MLTVTPNFTMADIQKDFEELEQNINIDLVQALTSSLKKMVDMARAKTRSDGGFGNITWNLRGSIGGVIMANHKVIETYFPKQSKGDSGREKGIAFATDLAYLQDDGEIILVFVAGESYAYYVEAREDYDVISGTNKKFDQLFKSALGL